MSEHDFYVGYQKNASSGVASFMKSRVAAFVLGALLVSGLVAWSHRAYHPSTFEFGVPRTLEGIVSDEPYPSLLIPRPGDVREMAPFSRFLLVAPGKFGADDIVEEFAGHNVTLEGSLVYQDGRSMVEIVPGTVKRAASNSGPVSVNRDLGTFTLHGEIVDSKCYLGVMNPGNTKTHKSCAIRCISGGIPPVLLVRNAGDGTALYFLLVDEEGGAVNERVLDMIAEPVAVTGKVIQQDDLFILKADPGTYKRNG